MIGAFARMIGSRTRIVAYEERPDHAHAVTSQEPDGARSTAEGRDAPPEAFVERIPDEGGDVYFAPLVEHLRQALKRHRTLPDLSERS